MEDTSGHAGSAPPTTDLAGVLTRIENRGHMSDILHVLMWHPERVDPVVSRVAIHHRLWTAVLTLLFLLPCGSPLQRCYA